MSTNQIKAAAKEFLKWFARHGHEHATLILKEGSMLYEVEYWHCRQCELLEDEGIPFSYDALDQTEIFAFVKVHTMGWTAQNFADHKNISQELKSNNSIH